MKNNLSIRKSYGRAFTLIELMISMGILSVLLLMMLKVLDTVQTSWTRAESRVGQFREARVAFDLVSKNLSQATMHNYWDLRVSDENVVEGYEKISELHFLTLPAKDVSSAKSTDRSSQLLGQALFFQAPLGSSIKYRNLNNLFNGRGYFVGYGGDDLFKPRFVDSDSKYRFRLFEFRPPAEDNLVFKDGQEERDPAGDGSQPGSRQSFTKWFKQIGGKGNFQDYLNPLAENIITLIVSPRDSIKTTTGGQSASYSDIAPKYRFNSNLNDDDFAAYSQQVPPLVRVTMIALDPGAAVRLADANGSSVPPEIENALMNRFEDTKAYDTDIKWIVDELNKKELAHKVFSTLVMLRSAKWSTSTAKSFTTN